MRAERQTRLSRSFLDVALQLTQDLDVDTILTTIVERAMELTSARYGAALTLSEASEIERFLHRGLSSQEVAALPHLPQGKGLLGAVLSLKETVRTDRIDTHPRSVGFPDSHVPMMAFLGVPIAHRGRLVGALYLSKPPQAPPFDMDDQELIEAMAALAAVAIENSRRLERAQQQAVVTEAIRQIASSVKTSLDAADVLSTTVEKLATAMKVTRCYIRMVEAPGAIQLGPIEHEWVAPGIPPLAGEPDIQYPVASLAAATRRTQWSDDVGEDPRLMDPGVPGSPIDLLRHDARAVLACPLERGDELIGVVVMHDRHARHWTDTEIGIVEAAAYEVSNAIHNAMLYEEALRAVEELQQLEARRADYISMISHEIRSPITVVAGIGEILQSKRDKLPPTAIDDLIGTLSREGTRLARLVSEVLDLERIDRGGMKIAEAELDLSGLAKEAIADTGESSRMILERPPRPLLVNGDRDKLKQVLINLISNAAKFAPERSPITVTVEDLEDEIRVGVRDEGPGIGPEDKERLFKRFSRLDSTAAKPGSGLGLYLSRLIVERHGGKIWVDSKPGAGTTFYFTVPSIRSS